MNYLGANGIPSDDPGIAVGTYVADEVTGLSFM